MGKLRLCVLLLHAATSCLRACHLKFFGLKQRMESQDQQKKDQSMLDHPLSPKQLQQVFTCLGGISAVVALYILSHSFFSAVPLLLVVAGSGYISAMDPFNLRRNA